MQNLTAEDLVFLDKASELNYVKSTDASRIIANILITNTVDYLVPE